MYLAGEQKQDLNRILVFELTEIPGGYGDNEPLGKGSVHSTVNSTFLASFCFSSQVLKRADSTRHLHVRRAGRNGNFARHFYPPLKIKHRSSWWFLPVISMSERLRQGDQRL